VADLLLKPSEERVGTSAFGFTFLRLMAPSITPEAIIWRSSGRKSIVASPRSVPEETRTRLGPGWESAPISKTRSPPSMKACTPGCEDRGRRAIAREVGFERDGRAHRRDARRVAQLTRTATGGAAVGDGPPGQLDLHLPEPVRATTAIASRPRSLPKDRPSRRRARSDPASGRRRGIPKPAPACPRAPTSCRRFAATSAPLTKQPEGRAGRALHADGRLREGERSRRRRAHEAELPVEARHELLEIDERRGWRGHRSGRQAPCHRRVSAGATIGWKPDAPAPRRVRVGGDAQHPGGGQRRGSVTGVRSVSSLAHQFSPFCAIFSAASRERRTPPRGRGAGRWRSRHGGVRPLQVHEAARAIARVTLRDGGEARSGGTVVRPP
jgi:hypothetical protein